MKDRIKRYWKLYLLLMLLSFQGICSKMAGSQEFLSKGFILWYMAVLFILFIYAVLWQQVIKNMPLSEAYARRAIVIVYGSLWGRIIFGESIDFKKMFGILLIIGGIILYAREN